MYEQESQSTLYSNHWCGINYHSIPTVYVHLSEIKLTKNFRERETHDTVLRKLMWILPAGHLSVFFFLLLEEGFCLSWIKLFKWCVTEFFFASLSVSWLEFRKFLKCSFFSTYKRGFCVFVVYANSLIWSKRKGKQQSSNHKKPPQCTKLSRFSFLDCIH